MSWYSGAGGGLLKDTPEVRKILKEFEKDHSGTVNHAITIAEEGVGVIDVSIEWNGITSQRGVLALDAKLEELIKYVAGDVALVFEYEYETEQAVLFVGTDEQVARSRSIRALLKVEALKETLQPEDKKKAIDLLSR